ncbi:MAG: hypothetical protein HYX80_03080 [Chloroflexi bacterium]|nr:hypothetical protein [Chloroflexota bacterium]
MPNPSGPYPGRQLFIGLTGKQEPCLAYLVTGRSPESRQRKATAAENTVRMGPLGKTALDPLRFHYTALKYDNSSGLAVLTNGLQTEAIYETYKLLFDVGTPATQDFMAKLLEGAKAEPDSLHTPRIAGAIVIEKGNPVFIVGIKTHDAPAAAYRVAPDASHLTGISTYQGDLDNPQPTSPTARLSWLEFKGSSPDEVAQYLHDLSAATYKDEDIRVCAIGGVYSGGSWYTSIINRH